MTDLMNAYQSTAEFISHLNSLDIKLWIEDNAVEPSGNNSNFETRLRCSAPSGILTASLRQELANRKAELIAYLSQTYSSRQTEASSDSISHLSSSTFPLSFAQQRLWFLYQLAPDNPFYNVPTAIQLTGILDQTALQRSIDAIVQRHAALRTTFTEIDGQPVQVVAASAKIELSIVDLQTVALSDRKRVRQQLARAEAQRPFNLTTDVLLRVTLLQFAATESVLLLTLHHIVADGWSLGVLMRELANCYAAFQQGQSPILPSLPMQYGDFARQQRQELQEARLEKQLTYWRKQLRDLTILQLPSDRPRPAVQTYIGATYSIQISPRLTQALEAFSQASDVSLFMTLLAAFQTLLYRYTGQEDIVIGSPIANRHRSELEGLIGFFVNSLVIRIDLSGHLTFRELLERVRDVALAAYEHQDLPFEKLVEDLDPDRDLSRNPLFQVAFALQNAPMQALKLPGLTLEPAPLESGSTRFDLELHLWEPTHGLRSLWQSQAGLSGFISYSTDLFDQDRIARLVGHFHTLLEGIIANPDACLSDLPLLTPAEQQLLVKWSYSSLTSDITSNIQFKSDQAAQTASELSNRTSHLCFHHLFEAQVQLAPDTIAVVSEQGSLTYSELNQRAHDLAQILRQLGVQPDTLVGLCVDRSLDMIIGILGILKAGGAYVPLDAHYPTDRLQFLLTDTQVPILLTQSWLADQLPQSSAQILYLDHPLPASALAVGTKLPGSQPDHLAYVIYTSGSTGTPKGVLLTHRGLCNVVAAQQQFFQPSRSSRILQFSSLSFDASIFEIALAFGSGGTLYIPPLSAQLPGMALVQFLEANAITHALLTPAVLAVLPVADLPALQVLITGGEACSYQVVERWAANRHFFNAYGPTETTIWATVAELHPGDSPQIIGCPILNTQVYILDANLNPVPAGIPGEIHIGGAGVARGYLNRPELTAERFIEFKRPFRDSGLHHQQSSAYKTGDRAFYRPDGTIEFLGRIDHQVKIRGFRVELGEIEAVLQHHPAIQDAVIVATGETSNDMRLVAYFSLNRQYLRQTLQSLQLQQIQHWQTLYNQTYQLAAIPQIFDTTGWQSSYTGQPIPLAEMQEWVSDRVEQILALKPKRVLEIGCGTGLLLFQIAPSCEHYVGTDFSAVTLASVQTQLETLPQVKSQVKLLHRTADDFEGIETAAFDLVILNSVVQYFPSLDYLIQVLEGAIQRVAPGGAVFIGDIRSLPLLTAFHTWVQFYQADDSLERDQLQQRVNRAQFEDPELAIDPAFFYDLRERWPHSQVQVRLSRGRSQNEMVQFRYNVLLYPNHISISRLSNIGDDVGDPGDIDDTGDTDDSVHKHNWKLDPITPEEIQKTLIDTQPEILVICNITNSRVNAAITTMNWLRSQKSPRTVGRMRQVLQNSTEPAVCPQDWWDLAAVVPYHIEIMWSSPHTEQYQPGDYDVLLTRKDSQVRINECTEPTASYVANYAYTNQPLQANIARQVIPELRQHLKQTLPDYMLPFAFVPLDAMPLTSNGKLDRRALPAEPDLSHSSRPVQPSTLTESTLVEMWQELLRLRPITVHDNFFELGGHSLLATQMVSRIRDTFKLELPLKSVFEAPTIAQLAPFLDRLRHSTVTAKIPPLVRLDRSAYRRKRSVLLDQSRQDRHNLQQQATSVESAVDSAGHADRPARVDLVIDARTPLIPLTLGGEQPPFFCVHPMFGVVFPYLDLAHYLGNYLHYQRSFYGLQPSGLDGKSPPLNRIEAIAAHYIQAIQTLQPQGPYFLGGWSFGGLVAFEMAQQLSQAGYEIGLLAILDTPAPCYKPSFSQRLKFLLGTAFWSTLPFLRDYSVLAANRLQLWQSWLSRWQWSAIIRLIPEASRLQLLEESAIVPMLRIVYAHAQAAYHYAPQPYADRITLFKAMEQSDQGKSEATLGWSAFAEQIELHSTPGNHLSLLKQPHVETLAQQLGECLQQ
jgi:amino acid adenylation domain-containing protein